VGCIGNCGDERLNRKTLTIVTFGIILAVSGILIYYTQILPQNEETGYGDISVAQAQLLIEAKPSLIILDVRTQAEYDSGHIENAILIPVDELGNRLDELSPNDELLVYCRTGNRSSNAVNILQSNGFTMIFHMEDGITGWIDAGYPIT
jgi:rhodanese-related sulfurtransferase